MKTYPIVDWPSPDELNGEKFSLNKFRAVKIGQYRPPMEGEWYLSGAIPEAYRALNDYSAPFHILEIVRVKLVQEYVVLGKI